MTALSCGEVLTDTVSLPGSADRGRRILVVEDERELCLTLGDRFRSEGYEVEFAHDGRTALQKASGSVFDLFLLDVMLPMESGLEVCVKLRKAGIAAPVLFLTARSQSVEKIAGFRAGGDDYLTKPFDTLELMVRVEALLRRSAGNDPKPADGQYEFGPVTLDVLRKKVIVRGETISLTPREFELLRYLAERSGRTVSREELLEEIWTDASSNFTRTVDMHIAGLRRKIESNPKSPELILTDPGSGYRFQP
ncbi:response regulator transcription factor [Acidobacteria bacterium AB60]|nr:response regulator transcription factor [Acidobacteria bacterium AB60]